MNLQPPIHVTTLEYDSYKEYIKNYEHSFELLTFIKQEKKKKEKKKKEEEVAQLHKQKSS